VVILPEALALVALGAVFERKAGSPFPNCLIVSLLKKYYYFKCQVNTFFNKTAGKTQCFTGCYLNGALKVS